MSPEVLAVLRLLHVAGFLFMAAPLYALVVVNERARFGGPPGYNTDRYMETIIRNQPQRCYIFLATVAATGLLLAAYGGWSWGALLTDWVLVTKWAVLLVLLGLLTYVHLGIQPQIDALLASLKPGETLPEKDRPPLVRLRTRRRRLGATCLFLVLTAMTMGIRLLAPLHILVLLAILALAALFAWRAYRVPVPFGWF
ncbi:MAG: hypothetical protein HY687_00095 [Chloroflexi bacterium]|nr:hypothetical protein [Chloroflexota bacterium]